MAASTKSVQLRSLVLLVTLLMLILIVVGCRLSVCHSRWRRIGFHL